MISIIVPVYNVEKYINKCVNSILNQTYKDLEIILVDDGSSDNCSEICDEFAKTDSRIKVVHKKNGGLMSARQAGLKEASGDYIGFVDGDDWIEPDMYQLFNDAVQKYHPDMVISEFFFDSGKKVVKSNQNLVKPYFNKNEMINEIYPEMLYKPPYYNFGVFPCCWAKLFRKELLESCLFRVPEQIKIGEDSAFTYPCLVRANSVAFVDKSCYHYMNNAGSITKSYDSDMENTILIPYEVLKQEFSNADYDFSSALNYYLFYLIEFVIRNEESHSNLKSPKQIKETLKRFITEDIISCFKEIDTSVLPIRKQFLLLIFKMKSTQLLYFYIKLFKMLK